MLLVRVKRRVRELREDGTRGSGLILVISVMAVLIVLSTLVAGMTTQSLGQTSSVRASVQSLAAAEAGVDYVAAQLTGTNACQASYSNPAVANAPVFTATVQYSLSASGNTWASCPIGSAAAVRIKIVSQGSAINRGVATQSARDTRKVEVIYGYTPSSPITASGGAMYSYNAGTFNSFRVLSSTSVGDVMIKKGTLSCTESSLVQGKVYVAEGDAILNNACQVTGDIWAAGKLTLQSGLIGGNALSASTGESTFGPNTRVGGFVDLAGTAFTSASRCPSPNNGWDENGYKCAIKQSIATGTVTFRDTTVQAPVVPDWLDYGFVPSTWTSAGFQILSWPTSVNNAANVCNVDVSFQASTFFTGTFVPMSVPTVWDTRTACPGGLTLVSGTLDWQMKTDIAFIENKVTIQGLNVTSSDSAAKRLWFITPDSNLTNHVPDCPAGGGASAVNTTTVINAPVVAMVYTPCGMSNSSNAWRGQIYGSKVDFNSNSSLTFVPVGMPGANLSTGTSGSTGGSGGVLGSELSSRDLNG